jgi:hypothetical protein
VPYLVTEPVSAASPVQAAPSLPRVTRLFDGLARPLRAGPANPLFPSDDASVAAALERLAPPHEPCAAPWGRRLPRPLLVLAGYRAPRWQATNLAAAMTRLTGAAGADVLCASYTWTGDLDSIVARVARAAAARWPAPGGAASVPVDVIGVSMGGLVARAAAAAAPEGAPDRPRLSIARLFTLATPHRGAHLAARVRVDSASRCMVPGSGWLRRLDAEPRGYELVPYAVLRDHMVGATNAAPPGHAPLWVPGPRGVSHQIVSYHPAILADLALRLLGLPPLALGPSPPPRD